MSLVEQLLQSALTAPDDRKDAALKILKGEVPPVAAAKSPAGPVLVGTTQAAKLLGVSRSTLWRMIRSGRLTRVEIYPGAFRLRRTELEGMGGGEGQTVSSSQLAVGSSGEEKGQTPVSDVPSKKRLKSETKRKNKPASPLAVPGNGE